MESHNLMQHNARKLSPKPLNIRLEYKTWVFDIAGSKIGTENCSSLSNNPCSTVLALFSLILSSCTH